ncbi:Argininosuccinate lyase [Rhynchospora pubera]|uniref:argininosuccinate lyase n=1 Tax=Rhynchospora pubera TaxID=906938 RepID=A0AAV8HNG6_9POAL|nr:Argininosuccinate lyase [Rhynchospora pubera]
MEEIRRGATKTNSSSSLYPLPSPPIDPNRHAQMSSGMGTYRQHHHQRRRHNRNHIHKPECMCFRHLTSKLCCIVLKKSSSLKKQLNGGPQQQDNQQELSFISYTADETNNSGFNRRGKEKKKSKFRCFKPACPRLPKKITCCCMAEPSRMSTVGPRHLTTGARPLPTTTARPPVRNASMETMLSGRNIEPAIVEQQTGSGGSVESIHIELVPDHQKELMREEEQKGTARKSVRNSVRTSVRTSVRSSKEVAETDESDLRDSSDYVEIIDRQESEHDEEDDVELEILLEENERELEESTQREDEKKEAERKERKLWAGRYNEGFNDVVEIGEEEKKETEKNNVKKERKVAERKFGSGRFDDAVNEVVERFTESVTKEADELYMHDIVGSRAHVKMLAAMGLITVDDRDVILNGLDEIKRLIEDGKFEWRKDRQDVHMNIEAALIDMVGEPAKKLHTARSRNDQVATDLRLWCRDAIGKILIHLRNLQVALVSLALDNKGLIIPGYTHLQRAQPVLLPHLLLSYVEEFERDTGRLVNCKDRLNYCPLGAGALAGTGLPIDRFATSDELKFTEPLRNSIDAVSDRDFILEFLSTNAITAIHLSRLGEEWVLWSSEEFGFLIANDKVTTGGNIIPQKNNPDPMELVRGKTARVVGDLVTLLVLCKGLPHAYNRDLQEDKEPLFDSVKTVIGMLEVSTEFARNISFNREKINSSLPDGYLDATTLVDYLVKKGIPFRTSHDIVGRTVAMGITKKCKLAELKLDDLRRINTVFEEDVYEYLGVENAIKKFMSHGSTGPEEVAKQLDFWVKKLEIKKLEKHEHQKSPRYASTE